MQERELVEETPIKHGKHTLSVEVDISWSELNEEYQGMIEELHMSTQKLIAESKADNQKKIEEQLAMMALVQISAQLQQTKITERLAAMALEQNAVRQHTTLLDEVKMLAPAKPEY